MKQVFGGPDLGRCDIVRGAIFSWSHVKGAVARAHAVLKHVHLAIRLSYELN